MSMKCVMCNEFYASVDDKCSVCSKVENFTITAKGLEKEQLSVFVFSSNDTILDVKKKISDEWGSNTDEIRVIFAGQQFDEKLTLRQANFRDGITVHVISRLMGD